MTSVNITTTKAYVTVTEGSGASTLVTTAARPSTIDVITAGPQGPATTGFGVPPRAATIVQPLDGDNLTLFKTASSTTLSSVTSLVSNGTVIYTLKYGPVRTGEGTKIIDTFTTTNTTTGDAAPLTNLPIPSNNYVWLELNSVDGNVREFNISLAF